MLTALRKAGLVRKIWRTEDAQGLPRGTGAYLLFIQIEAPVNVVYNRRSDALEPGWYVYAGSANGPGGLGARISRHFNEGKSVRWHVDHLTTKGKVWAMAVPGGAECPLVSALEKTGEFVHPLEGFGSSDCAKCVSHLLAFSGKA